MATVAYDVTAPGYWSYNTTFSDSRYTNPASPPTGNVNHTFLPGREVSYDNHAFWSAHATDSVASVKVHAINCRTDMGCQSIYGVEITGDGVGWYDWTSENISVEMNGDAAVVGAIMTPIIAVQLQQIQQILVNIRRSDTSYAGNGVYLIEITLGEADPEPEPEPAIDPDYPHISDPSVNEEDVVFILTDPGFWDTNTTYTNGRYTDPTGDYNQKHEFEPGRGESYGNYAFWSDYDGARVLYMQFLIKDCSDSEGSGWCADTAVAEIEGTGFSIEDWTTAVTDIDGNLLEFRVAPASLVQLTQLEKISLYLHRTDGFYGKEGNGVYDLRVALRLPLSSFWNNPINATEYT